MHCTQKVEDGEVLPSRLPRVARYLHLLVVRHIAEVWHNANVDFRLTMLRHHHRAEEFGYPNSGDIQIEEIQSEEIQSENYQGERVFTSLHIRSSWRPPSLLHVVNSFFVLVASLAIIGPPILDKGFSIQIGVSQSNHLDAGLHQGDLLIIRDTKISQIASGDLVIVHGIVGETPEQQHLGSAIATANSKTLNVSVMGDSGRVSATESVTMDSKIQVVERYFPKVGTILNLLICNLVKIGFVFVVGMYNLIAYFSRRRYANPMWRSRGQFSASLAESASLDISAGGE